MKILKIVRIQPGEPFAAACHLDQLRMCFAVGKQGRSMVKEAKFFPKQADKARSGASITPERSAGLRAMVRAYRSQTDVLKMPKKRTEQARDADR